MPNSSLTNDIAESLTAFTQGPGREAAEELGDLFEQAGARIANSLESAALSGEFSFRDLAESITRDLANLAIRELVINPLQSSLQGLLSSGAGVGNAGQSVPNIVMNISGVSDAQSLQKSQGQISNALARAVSQGQKFG